MNEVLSSPSSTFQDSLESELATSFQDLGIVSVSNMYIEVQEDPDSSTQDMMIIFISIGVAVTSLLCLVLITCFGCGLYHGIQKTKAPVNIVVPGTTVELVQETADNTTNLPTAIPTVIEESPVIDMRTGMQYKESRPSRPMMEWIRKARRSFVTYGQSDNNKTKQTSKEAWL